ncbi:acyltransferase, partial [Streptomyces sp. NPDC057445]
NRTGTALNWAALHQHKHQHTTTIPTYPFNRQELSAPPARRRIVTGAVGRHPLFDRHYEHQSEGQ